MKPDERKALVEAINQAFEDEPPTAEEKEVLRGIQRTQSRIDAGDSAGTWRGLPVTMEKRRD